MTEDEARTKLCHVTLKHLAFDADHQPARGATCVASQCMAWMVSHQPGDDGFCGLAGGTSRPNYGYPPGTVTPPTEPTPS